MFLRFFNTLRDNGIPCTTRELLNFLAVMEKGLIVADINGFYTLARTTLVKDERFFDKFDRAFDIFFKGVEELGEIFAVEVPDEWIKAQMERDYDDEEMARIESLGGIEKLVEEFKKRWLEQKERHEGGSRWIGTAGTSPFGNAGAHPEGMKVGGEGGKGKGVKVWQQRNYRNLDDQVELGTRNIKLALRRLRHFTRTGLEEELNISGTVRKTANNGGMLQLDMRPEKLNSIKVLVFFDVGGSMDPYVRICEELFSACRTEFKHLEYFYFHNCLYESVWKDNRRRQQQRIPTWDILNKYAADYRVIIIGDATMAPYEITHPGGSIEHWNEEAGMVWLQRFMDQYKKLLWLNPVPAEHWDYAPSIEITRRLMEEKMYGLTLGGLTDSMEFLAR